MVCTRCGEEASERFRVLYRDGTGLIMYLCVKCHDRESDHDGTVGLEHAPKE